MMTERLTSLNTLNLYQLYQKNMILISYLVTKYRYDIPDTEQFEPHSYIYIYMYGIIIYCPISLIHDSTCVVYEIMTKTVMCLV